MDGTYTTYAGTAGSRISVRLSAMAGDYDVEVGQTFRIFVRPVNETTFTLDALAESDATEDIIFYDPIDTDFLTPGNFKAWFHLVESDVDTEEFDILVLEHAPGTGTRIGAVARSARAISPVAWDALKGYRDYGDSELQHQIELAKLRVLKVAITVTAENALDLRVVDYIAKKALVDSILPAVRDFWTNQLISQTALGNSQEVKTYPDRINAIGEQIKQLKQALLDQVAEVEDIIGSIGTASQPMELIGGGLLLTPSLGDVVVNMEGCDEDRDQRDADWRWQTP